MCLVWCIHMESKKSVFYLNLEIFSMNVASKCCINSWKFMSNHSQSFTGCADGLNCYPANGAALLPANVFPNYAARWRVPWNWTQNTVKIFYYSHCSRTWYHWEKGRKSRRRKRKSDFHPQITGLVIHTEINWSHDLCDCQNMIRNLWRVFI